VSLEAIPTEIRARIEATAFFDALRAGDYAGAAQAQERLHALGWRLSREPAATGRQARRKPSRDAGGPGVGQ
jgi:hypothetical protein